MAAHYTQLRDAWLWAWVAVVAANTVEIAAHPNGWAWTALRIVLFALWLALLAGFVLAWWARRRQGGTATS